MAFLLKERAHVEAIPVGVERFTRESLAELAVWADYVIVMQPQFADYFEPQFKPKIRCVDVGVDRFGNWNHVELLGGLERVVEDWIQREFAI